MSWQNKEEDLKIRKKISNQAKGVASGWYLEDRWREGGVIWDGWKVLKFGGDGGLDQP